MRASIFVGVDGKAADAPIEAFCFEPFGETKSGKQSPTFSAFLTETHEEESRDEQEYLHHTKETVKRESREVGQDEREDTREESFEVLAEDISAKDTLASADLDTHPSSHHYEETSPDQPEQVQEKREAEQDEKEITLEESVEAVAEETTVADAPVPIDLDTNPLSDHQHEEISPDQPEQVQEEREVKRDEMEITLEESVEAVAEEIAAAEVPVPIELDNHRVSDHQQEETSPADRPEQVQEETEVAQDKREDAHEEAVEDVTEEVSAADAPVPIELYSNPSSHQYEESSPGRPEQVEEVSQDGMEDTHEELVEAVTEEISAPDTPVPIELDNNLSSDHQCEEASADGPEQAQEEREVEQDDRKDTPGEPAKAVTEEISPVDTPVPIKLDQSTASNQHEETSPVSLNKVECEREVEQDEMEHIQEHPSEAVVEEISPSDSPVPNQADYNPSLDQHDEASPNLPLDKAQAESATDTQVPIEKVVAMIEEITPSTTQEEHPTDADRNDVECFLEVCSNQEVSPAQEERELQISVHSNSSQADNPSDLEGRPKTPTVEDIDSEIQSDEPLEDDTIASSGSETESDGDSGHVIFDKEKPDGLAVDQAAFSFSFDVISVSDREDTTTDTNTESNQSEGEKYNTTHLDENDDAAAPTGAAGFAEDLMKRFFSARNVAYTVEPPQKDEQAEEAGTTDQETQAEGEQKTSISTEITLEANVFLESGVEVVESIRGAQEQGILDDAGSTKVDPPAAFSTIKPTILPIPEKAAIDAVDIPAVVVDVGGELEAASVAVAKAWTASKNSVNGSPSTTFSEEVEATGQSQNEITPCGSPEEAKMMQARITSEILTAQAEATEVERIKHDPEPQAFYLTTTEDEAKTSVLAEASHSAESATSISADGSIEILIAGENLIEVKASVDSRGHNDSSVLIPSDREEGEILESELERASSASTCDLRAMSTDNICLVSSGTLVEDGSPDVHVLFFTPQEVRTKEIPEEQNLSEEGSNTEPRQEALTQEASEGSDREPSLNLPQLPLSPPSQEKQEDETEAKNMVAVESLQSKIKELESELAESSLLLLAEKAQREKENRSIDESKGKVATLEKKLEELEDQLESEKTKALELQSDLDRETELAEELRVSIEASTRDMLQGPNSPVTTGTETVYFDAIAGTDLSTDIEEETIKVQELENICLKKRRLLSEEGSLVEALLVAQQAKTAMLETDKLVLRAVHRVQAEKKQLLQEKIAAQEETRRRVEETRILLEEEKELLREVSVSCREKRSLLEKQEKLTSELAAVTKRTRLLANKEKRMSRALQRFKNDRRDIAASGLVYWIANEALCFSRLAKECFLASEYEKTLISSASSGGAIQDTRVHSSQDLISKVAYAPIGIIRHSLSVARVISIRSVMGLFGKTPTRGQSQEGKNIE